MTQNWFITTGGVASTSFESWAHDYLFRKRGSTHRRNPHIKTNGSETRVIYIVGDPRDQLLSFFRRGFMRRPFHHCTHVDGDTKFLARVPRKWSLEEYLAEEYDAYKIYEHFVGWRDYDAREYRLLIVRYDELASPEVRSEVCDFFGVPRSNPFPFKQRRSNYLHCPANNRKQLFNMFEPMIQCYNELPPLTYLEAACPA